MFSCFWASNSDYAKKYIGFSYINACHISTTLLSTYMNDSTSVCKLPLLITQYILHYRMTSKLFNCSQSIQYTQESNGIDLCFLGAPKLQRRDSSNYNSFSSVRLYHLFSRTAPISPLYMITIIYYCTFVHYCTCTRRAVFSQRILRLVLDRQSSRKIAMSLLLTHF